jgi:putative transposase
VVWNDALALCKSSEKLPNYNQLSGLLTSSKKAEERAWLNEVSSVPLPQSLRHLASAYKNFFEARKGKSQGKKVGLPKFKKRTNKQSAEFVKSGFSLKENEVYLAKIGCVKPIWSRELPGTPTSVTVIKDGGNRYFRAFCSRNKPS